MDDQVVQIDRLVIEYRVAVACAVIPLDKRDPASSDPSGALLRCLEASDQGVICRYRRESSEVAPHALAVSLLFSLPFVKI